MKSEFENLSDRYKLTATIHQRDLLIPSYKLLRRTDSEVWSHQALVKEIGNMGENVSLNDVLVKTVRKLAKKVVDASGVDGLVVYTAEINPASEINALGEPIWSLLWTKSSNTNEWAWPPPSYIESGE